MEANVVQNAQFDFGIKFTDWTLDFGKRGAKWTHLSFQLAEVTQTLDIDKMIQSLPFVFRRTKGH